MKTFVMLLSHELCWCKSRTETIPGAQVLGEGAWVETGPGGSGVISQSKVPLLWLLRKERSEVAFELKPQ